MSDDERNPDFTEYAEVFLTLARKEVEQTRKNLERELAEWKARYGEASSRIGRLREIARIYRRSARQDALDAVKAFNKKSGEENAPKSERAES